MEYPQVDIPTKSEYPLRMRQLRRCSLWEMILVDFVWGGEITKAWELKECYLHTLFFKRKARYLRRNLAFGGKQIHVQSWYYRETQQ